MKLKYLEFVSSNADALCATYAKLHGITFSEPVAALGNARVAELPEGYRIGIRAQMRHDETLVVRPYLLVDNVAQALDAAKAEGAEIAVPAMELPGQGTIGIYIKDGIESGLWQRD